MRKVQCPVCKKYVSFFVPKGGDGSGVRVRRHVSALDGFTNPCDGYYMVIDYSGSAEDRRNRVLPDYNENGTANPKGDASYWRARAERAEATVRAELDHDELAKLLNEKDAKVAALTAALQEANEDAARLASSLENDAYPFPIRRSIDEKDAALRSHRARVGGMS